MIVIGYQGIGKSTLANDNVSKIKFIDLESSCFWNDGKRSEDCPNNYDESREMEIVKEIISDMEKLQKIEEIVDEMWDENSYYNNTVRFAEKIEQIVRGE